MCCLYDTEKPSFHHWSHDMTLTLTQPIAVILTHSKKITKQNRRFWSYDFLVCQKRRLHYVLDKCFVFWLLLLDVAQGARVSGIHCFLWPILCLHFKLNIPALPYKFPLTRTEALMTCTEFAHSLIYSWLPAPAWKERNGSNVVLASFLSHPLILVSVSLYSVSKHSNDFRQYD